MFVIGFNGPPKSGKDSIAQCIRTLLDHESDTPTFMDHLARPMREAAMMLAGYDPKDFGLYNRVKDEPQALLNGDTIRHFMIQLSESFMKKRYGYNFWGRKLIHDNVIQRHTPGIFFIPDIGFQPEIVELEKAVGPDQLMIIHLHRPKIDWGKDSRRFCVGHDKHHLLNLHNDSDILTASQAVIDVAKTYGFLA